MADIEALSSSSAALRKYSESGKIVLARDWLETTLR